MAGRRAVGATLPSSDVTAEDAFLELEAQYARPLDDGQRLAIGNNLAGFFALLQEWDLKQHATEEEQPSESDEDSLQEEEEWHAASARLP